ncbi:MAG TPA: hypothetical protein DGG95_15230 [Cytophagales bacterium]|jgi:hypothetical protein|nr:hypothetical protein [Cytophagales bacterium]
MWQRVQTIFLAVAIACLVAMIFFPVWEVKGEEVRLTLYPLYYRSQMGTSLQEIYFPYCFIAILGLAAATISFIEIQKFENRLLQLKLGALNSLFMAGCGFTAVYLSLQLQKTVQAPGNFGLALYLPFAAMLLNAIANRFIRKDENLVKDSDRLR